MGEFSITCGISNQTIYPEDRVKLIVLSRDNNAYYLSNCYTPAYLPVSGIYNGYGHINRETILEDYTPIKKYLSYLEKDPTGVPFILNKRKVFPCYVLESVYNFIVGMTNSTIFKRTINVFSLKELLYYLGFNNKYSLIDKDLIFANFSSFYNDDLIIKIFSREIYIENIKTGNKEKLKNVLLMENLEDSVELAPYLNHFDYYRALYEHSYYLFVSRLDYMNLKKEPIEKNKERYIEFIKFEAIRKYLNLDFSPSNMSYTQYGYTSLTTEYLEFISKLHAEKKGLGYEP